jgi:hypothetical protein
VSPTATTAERVEGGKIDKTHVSLSIVFQWNRTQPPQPEPPQGVRAVGQRVENGNMNNATIISEFAVFMFLRPPRRRAARQINF